MPGRNDNLTQDISIISHTIVLRQFMLSDMPNGYPDFVTVNITFKRMCRIVNRNVPDPNTAISDYRITIQFMLYLLPKLLRSGQTAPSYF